MRVLQPCLTALQIDRIMGDHSVKLLEFSGNVDADKMTVVEYINHVDMSRIAGGWDDAITAEKVKLKLTGPARTWLQNRIRARDEGLAVFEPPAVNGVFPPGLRAILLTRFLPTQLPVTRKD